MAPIRVLVVDDHQVFADALSVCLEAEPGIQVVEKATSIARARAAIDRLEPDVVVLDVELGDEDGLDVARILTGERGGPDVVVLSCHDDVDAACAALRAGAAAFVSKSAASEDVVAAVQAAHRGESWLAPALLRDVLRHLIAGPSAPSEDEALIAKLSAREREVLSLMVAGLDRATIASRLYLSPNTVRTHAQNMLAKLGVQSSLEAVGVALRAGLRPEQPSDAMAVPGLASRR